MIDAIDAKILEILATEGRLPASEIARRVGLSISPCQVRIRKLENSGCILGYRAVLSPTMLDLEHVVFTEVKLENTSESTVRAFNEMVRGIPEIEECHLIAGSFDYLLKIRTKDIRAFRMVIAERITKLPGLASTSTHISMEPSRKPLIEPLPDQRTRSVGFAEVRSRRVGRRLHQS